MNADDATITARMRILARLARPTAHDLHGALNAIAMHLELLRSTLDASADPDGIARGRRYLEVLDEERRRLQRVADAFLDLVALPGGAGEIDLAALVASVGNAARPLATAVRVRLEVEESAPMPTAVPDPEACRQRLLDAVVHALLGGSPGATVRLALAPSGRDATLLIVDPDSPTASAPDTVASVQVALLQTDPDVDA